jgi:hypothetical protein
MTFMLEILDLDIVITRLVNKMKYLDKRYYAREENIVKLESQMIVPKVTSAVNKG